MASIAAAIQQRETYILYQHLIRRPQRVILMQLADRYID
jgi:hypothetical protein